MNIEMVTNPAGDQAIEKIIKSIRKQVKNSRLCEAGFPVHLYRFNLTCLSVNFLDEFVLPTWLTFLCLYDSMGLDFSLGPDCLSNEVFNKLLPESGELIFVDATERLLEPITKMMYRIQGAPGLEDYSDHELVEGLKVFYAALYFETRRLYLHNDVNPFLRSIGKAIKNFEF